MVGVGTIVDLIFAAFGAVISIFLSPLFSGKVASLYYKVGLYRGPEIEVNAAARIGDFESTSETYGNIDWEESFRIISISIKNEGERTIENLQTDIFFPGVVRHVRNPNMGEAEFSVLDRRVVDVTEDGQEKEVAHSSKKITSKDIHPGQQLYLEFLVDLDLGNFNYFHDFNPDPEFSIQYRWMANGYPFEEHVNARIQQADSEYASALVYRGIQLREENSDPEGAIADFDHALEIVDGFPPALYQKGITHFEAGKARLDVDHVEEAVSIFEKLVEESSKNSTGWKRLGECYLWLIRTSTAENDQISTYKKEGKRQLERGLKFNPANSELLALLDGLENADRRQNISPEEGKVTITYKPPDSKPPNSVLLDTKSDDGKIELRLRWTDTNYIEFDFSSKNRRGTCRLDLGEYANYDRFKISGIWNSDRVGVEVQPLDGGDVKILQNESTIETQAENE